MRTVLGFIMIVVGGILCYQLLKGVIAFKGLTGIATLLGSGGLIGLGLGLLKYEPAD